MKDNYKRPDTGLFRRSDVLSEIIGKLDLKHFIADEIEAASHFGEDVTDNRFLLNIVPCMLILDQLRGIIGRPIRITSAYRNKKYNMYVGGSHRSQHTAFKAVDFSVDGINNHFDIEGLVRSFRGGVFKSNIKVINQKNLEVPNKPLEVFDSRVDISRCCFEWRGGIGLSENFVHIDTRGYDAYWTY